MRVKALAVVVLFFAALILPLAAAQAADGAERYTEWYSDATKTDVVGWMEELCGGIVNTWGYQTAYKEVWIGNRCEYGVAPAAVATVAAARCPSFFCPIYYPNDCSCEWIECPDGSVVCGVWDGWAATGSSQAPMSRSF